MGNAIKSEFRKFFTTRLWWGLAIVMFIAAALFAILFAFIFTTPPTPESIERGQPTGTPLQIANSVYTSGLNFGYTITAVIGILQIGSEYRHKTVTSTFLSTPKRARVMVAKIIALLGIGAIYGAISLLGSVVAGAVTLQARGAEVFPSTEVLRSLALSLLVLGLWALIGLGVGILIPNQVAALLITIGAVWVVEAIASFALGYWDFGREHLIQFLPGRATNSIVAGVTQTGAEAPNTLSWWAAALVLAAYAALLSAFGTWRTVRQDIS
jgi:ABC-type transport system involved in multi-copper enzyme maturation permease subunit